MTADFELDTCQLGPLPVINAFTDRLGLVGLLETFLPGDAPASSSRGHRGRSGHPQPGDHRRPVYALGEWAAPFDPALLGLTPGEAELCNDDRVGRMLARLFDTDRSSLLTRLVLDAIATLDLPRRLPVAQRLDVNQVRGRPRGGERTPAWGQAHRRGGAWP